MKPTSKPRRQTSVQGLREVRFPDIRWTLDRPTVEVTDSMSICRRVISVPAGDGRSVKGGPMWYPYAISFESDTNTCQHLKSVDFRSLVMRGMS